MSERRIEQAPAPAHLVARLTSPRRKRILALDGGGTRGMITLAFLAEIEALLRERFKDDPRFQEKPLVLADYFDLIGGTSVGALIGTMIALGHDVATVEQKFVNAAPQIFKPKLAGRVPIASLFSASPLRDFIDREVGSETLLGDKKLKTGLVVITKRLDKGSVWALTNHPTHPYYFGQLRNDEYRNGNSDYRLSDVLRASTAAPRYFTPKAISIFKDFPDLDDGVFVDGGASPHNNPALKLFMMAGISGYNFGGGELRPAENRRGWALGADNLLIVSVGTGGYAHTARSSWTSGGDGIDSLLGLVSDGQELALTLLQWLSMPKSPWTIDRVTGNMVRDLLHIRPKSGGDTTRSAIDRNEGLLSFERFDAPLEAEWLSEHLGRNFSPRRLAEIRDFTNTLDLRALAQIGEAAAKKQVTSEHLPRVFDDIWSPDG